MKCSPLYAHFFMPGCQRECERVRLIPEPPLLPPVTPADRLERAMPAFVSKPLSVSSRQSAQWRRQIGLQHFTADQIKDQLHRSRQVLLAVRAGVSVQMSPHRHHLARLFTGQWQDKRPTAQRVSLWKSTHSSLHLQYVVSRHHPNHVDMQLWGPYASQCVSCVCVL